MHDVIDRLPGGPKTTLKFCDPEFTVKSERRATVEFRRLETLWVNTGTLCNIECANCYIESSPLNDRLSYITLRDLTGVLDEAARIGQVPRVIGFTGGEPFMNPAAIEMLDIVLSRGHDVLVLTNAMQPMMRARIQAALLSLQHRFAEKLSLRVSLDHWQAELHDEERGTKSFEIALRGLKWLTGNRFRVTLPASRSGQGS